MPDHTKDQSGGATTPGLALHATTSDGVRSRWVTVSGEIDVATAPDLAEALSDAQGSALVVLDLSEVSFIDASGVRLLVDAIARARGAGHRLVLARPSPVVTEALRRVGADGLTDRFDAVAVRPGRVTDEQLMAQVVAGDSVAFGQLYDRFASRAHRVARSVCRDAATAEDAVQEGFLSVWRSRATYRPQRAGVATWLLMIVRRKAIDIVRSRGALDRPRAAAEALEVCPDDSDVAQDVMARHDHRALRSELSRLPPGQLEVVSLAFFGELTHTEIAAHLGIPVGTVKGRMRLGLDKLRVGVLASGRTVAP